MSDVATLPPIMMGQFEVIPTRRGWQLVEWGYDDFGWLRQRNHRVLDQFAPLLRPMMQ